MTFGLTYGTLATTSRSGYTFNGWYTAASGGSQKISTSTVTTASNHILYAQWLAPAIEYIVPIDSNILAEYGNDDVLDRDLSNQEIYINDGGWIQVWDGSTTHAGVSINFESYTTLRQALNANYFLYWYGDDWLEDWDGVYVMNFDFKIIG